MFPRTRNELISQEVEVTLVHRNPSISPEADQFAAKVHVATGTIRLRPVDSAKRGIKMHTSLFEGAPAAPVSGEGEEEEEGQEGEEQTLMATLHFKDELETLYKTVHFKLSPPRPEGFAETAEKFRNLLHYAWCEAPQDPVTPHSQPLPVATRESAATPAVQRSATDSPASSESSSMHLMKSATKMSRSASKRTLSLGRSETDRGASSEETGLRSDLKSVEEYRKVAKFFEEVASSVYRMEQPKRARIVRVITDIVELAAAQK